MGLDQPKKVLVRALGGHAEQDRRLSQRQLLTQARLGGHGDGRLLADPERHHVDLAGGHAQMALEVGRRGVSVDHDPVRPASRSRHEHAHPQTQNAEMCLRHELVVDVMDGRHAQERAAQRRRGTEAVHEFATRSRSHARQVLLLPTDPLHTVAGPDRNCLVRDLEPRAFPRVSGLAVHERGGLHAVDGGQSRD